MDSKSDKNRESQTRPLTPKKKISTQWTNQWGKKREQTKLLRHE